MYTALVLGGYGFFGARISAMLAATKGLRVLVGGRDRARAQGTVRRLRLPEDCAVVVDARAPGLARTLRELSADLVIHTAGPFQGQDYRVARAAIEAGCHYIDLADARDFVAGIGALASAAVARGVSVVSGASSVPALSAAVVERYRDRLRRLDEIHVGISSGAYTPGPATLRAVLSYGGKAFRAWREGAWVQVYGWRDPRRHEFPPPLGPRWLANCDVPDLELFPHRYAPVRTVSFQAGTASTPAQLLVCGLAALVRAGTLGSAAGWAGALHGLGRLLAPLASSQGGMFVRLEGAAADGAPLALVWNVLAWRNHGVHIPCAPAVALAARLAAGGAVAAGARPCVGLLTVEEILAPLRGLAIREITP